ncbi:protealysin inhibitor emfourin [Arthrobacter cryoconiti]|uniref:Protealysin inhibitor emfourin n=1 Tax=Arthrobacter cryoconiti TaxID=748907 RepID=A0ABV8R3R2_9MICC|nr:protealysin inhibitor emfourin [Arthrobacter cryoconiti]MCC9067179.1 hypothetical protein [Arthrobacter cryoconiti]
MKLTVRIGGGFAGVVSVIAVDSTILPVAQAQALAAEVDRAQLRSIEPPAAAQRRPDAQLYEVLLQDGEKRFKLHFTDESIPADVEKLVHWMRQCPDRQESLEA